MSRRVVEDVEHRVALGTTVQKAVRKCCTIEAASHST